MKYFVAVLPFVFVACSQNINQSQIFAASSSGIVNGETVKSSDPLAKHLVAITDNKWENCTGTLIAKNLVLTAGHCETAGTAMYVAFGLEVSENNLKKVDRRLVTNYRLIPGRQEAANDQTDTKDLMIVEFEGGLPAGYEPAEFLQDSSLLKNEAMVVIVGYGVTDGKKQTGDGILRKVQVPIAEADYSKTEAKTNESKRGSCQIDSGGPGFLNANGKFYLWGVVSRGDENCEEYGVYTKVAPYKDWVDSVLKDLATP